MKRALNTKQAPLAAVALLASEFTDPGLSSFVLLVWVLLQLLKEHKSPAAFSKRCQDSNLSKHNSAR